MPSRRNGKVIDAIANEVGKLGKLPVHRCLVRNEDSGFQEEQSNSAYQLANVWGRLSVDIASLPERPVLDQPVLLIDDSADSRWTLTVAAFVLQEANSGPVLPFVLQTR